jgi:signal transduction histidine kinase/CheY-like chemotaxis protein
MENFLSKEVLSLLDEAYTLRINNVRRSIELTSKALGMSRSQGEKSLTAQCLSRLSLYTMITGEYKDSMRYGEEAIELFRDLKNDAGIADAKYNIAGVFYKTDNCHMGLVYLIDCLSTYRQKNDWHNISRCEKSLGTIYEYFGDQKNAFKSYENALEAAIRAGDINLESNVYNPLSGIYLKQGQIQKAMETIEKAITIKKDSGDLRGLAFAIYGRAKVFARLNLHAEAERDYIEALGIHSNMSEKLGLAMAYQKLGMLYLKSGQYQKAEEILLKGISFSSEFNNVVIKFKCQHALYELYRQTGNSDKALHYLEEYLSQREAVINTQTLKIIENYELITRMETIEKEAAMEREKAEITAKMMRAEQAVRVRQEFLSAMSHEIRTPLNAVLTIASMLPARGDAEEDKLLDSLKFSANNLLYIVNDILDFTRLESGKVKLDPRPSSFAELMEKIANSYRAMAAGKGLQMDVMIDEQIKGSYVLDENRIAQILGNLLSNAIKYTQVGHVELEAGLVKSSALADTIRFIIKDTGEGIPADMQKAIFESFTLLNNVTTRKEGGTGLGLAIVKKLIELHGSEIHVNSQPGSGSIFYFDLELKKSNPKAAVAEPQDNVLKGRIALLAEDNPMNAFVATRLLSTWGIGIRLARNGREAIEMAAAEEFDFILMDIHMPEMNGYEATEHIRTHDNPNRHKPIFALTADITAMQEEHYVQYFNGFLWKPLEVKKLYEAVAASLIQTGGRLAAIA